MSMTRRQRLQATLRGEPVDRPAVSFYEIEGYRLDPDAPDPWNVASDPSWQPLIQLAREHTDIMRMTSPKVSPYDQALYDRYFATETWQEDTPDSGLCRFTRTTVHIDGHTLTELMRTDADIDTTWKLEPLLKDTDDVEAFLTIPVEALGYKVDCSHLADQDQELGDTGILLLNIADPLCEAAGLFEMADYTIIAMTEPELFHRLLSHLSHRVYHKATETARQCPGQLWRVVGSEYASEPYLPPRLYEEYEVRYTQPIVNIIKQSGGYVRQHSHGNLKNILPCIQAMNVDGLDPIEPPPQGDVTLADVKQHYGQDMVLFGNLEASDIENLPPDAFEQKVRAALEEGTAGQGRGFVLMPSSSPYGRTITDKTLCNYQTMVRLAQTWNCPA